MGGRADGVPSVAGLAAGRLVAALDGLPVVVAGGGVSGTAAARHLVALGARVTVVDTREVTPPPGATAERDTGDLPAGTGLVVTSPGWRPTAPLLAAALAAGVPVWGEPELAWRLGDTPWLVVTGTNGKTTTTGMLASVLASAGLSAPAVGNVGAPVIDAVLAEPPHDVLAVELSSFQIHWSPSVRPLAAAVLNVAPDHLDWHGSLAAYAAAKAAVLADAATLAVVNADDEGSRRLPSGGRRVSFTLGPPEPGQLGVRAGVLVDEAFGAGPLLPAAALRVPGPHNVANALAAAALALAHEVPVEAVADGLAAYAPGAHRLEPVAVRDGVTFVDDSKATNPHAAAAALASFDRVVWLAGGLNKGLAFDELVAATRSRLRAVVLIGSCADEIAAALARHAPEIPVDRASGMDDAVDRARRLARPGDTVLLAPAAASMDMFRDYAARGEEFTRAARAVGGGSRPVDGDTAVPNSDGGGGEVRQ